MTAQLLEGGPVAEILLEDIRARVKALTLRGVTPGLGTILVGSDSASMGYIRKKHETCKKVGIKSLHVHLTAEDSQVALGEVVSAFNSDPAIHAYIIQHPVPEGFDFNAALSQMDPLKDADGIHPTNLGKLVLQEAGPLPCTPAGIQAMFVHYGINIAGKHVVIVGRGPTLGRPLSLLLTTKNEGANAAVTVVHSAIDPITDFTRRADVLVAAVGIPGFVTPSMVKPGAVVVSGGISWEGKKLLADVDESVEGVASWVTPRLGGVGPTTVAMLLRNTVEAAERSVA